MTKIKVAIVGVGNVASALFQSLGSVRLPGLWHRQVGAHSIRDIEIVAAYDVDNRKIGAELSESLFSFPNVGPKFIRRPKTHVIVERGIIKDGTPAYMSDHVDSTQSIAESLQNSGAEIVLNLIPSGMPKTSIAYAEQCLSAGVSFVNATPARVALNVAIQKKFKKQKLVVVGDDLMSQFGGTAFHKGILDFINSRGIRIEKSYQLDVGGGNETLNTISENVKVEKREIKTQAIAAEVPYKFATVAGTTDYVDYMGNNRTSYFWISGKGVFDTDIGIDIYLRTNDGANSVNVLLDVIRAVSFSLKRRDFGSPSEINEYGFKKLAKQVMLHTAHARFNKKYVK